MATLRVPIDAARRIAVHSIPAPEQMPHLVDFSQEGDQPLPQYHIPTEPCVLLLHPDGVYLISNGRPHDLLDGTPEHGRRFVACADACHQRFDHEWFETARRFVGADDFSETLTWANAILKLVRNGVTDAGSSPLDTRGNANVITRQEEPILKEEAMKARVVRIGNSRGIRIPKAVIEQCHLHGAVELEIQQGQLIIRSANKARAGWDQAFAEMHRHGDDQLMDRESASISKWDRKDWTW